MRWREGGGHDSKETEEGEEETEETEKEETEKTEETEKEEERARRRFEISKDRCCFIVASWTLTGGTF